eukprot:10232204-Alexandrium_andersonii.AAC.1
MKKSTALSVTSAVREMTGTMSMYFVPKSRKHNAHLYPPNPFPPPSLSAAAKTCSAVVECPNLTAPKSFWPPYRVAASYERWHADRSDTK